MTSPLINRRTLLAAAPVAFVPVPTFVAQAQAAEARVSSASPPPQLPGGQILHVNGTDLWVCDTDGNSVPIVLFHPITGSGHVWSDQLASFSKAGFRVIAYSRRGYRGSGIADPAKPGIGAEDLLALVDALNIPRFHAVGTAGGAFVAADFALSHPDRVTTLTVACSILGASGRGFDSLQKALSDPAISALPVHLRELGPSYRATNPRGVTLWKDLNDHALSGPQRVIQPLSNSITLEALATLRMPRLLIAGDADLIAPPPFLRLFAEAMPGSQLRVLPECGHSAYWESPEIFNSTVLEFLKRHG